MRIYTADPILAGANYLAVAESGVRLVASCKSSGRLVMLDIASMDEFPIVGWTNVLTDAPEALVVDEDAETIFVLCGETIRTFSTAATPVANNNVFRHDDNNRWIYLVGDSSVVYPDGNAFVVATRDALNEQSRLNTSVGRCGFGLYDNDSNHLYVFSESTHDVDIFAVDPDDGTAIPVGRFRAVGLNPVFQGIIVDGVMYLITHDSHRLSSYDLTDPTDPELVNSARFELGPFNSIDDISDLEGRFLITDDQWIRGSSDRFDWTPDRFGLYHAGRGFVAHGNTGRVSADTVLYAFNDDTGEFERVEPDLPAVNAGVDQSIAFDTAALVGTTYGPNSGSLTFAWSKVSGPGTVSFSAGTSLTTNATASVTGDYVLRLTGTFGDIVVTDEVAIRLVSTRDIIAVVPPGTHYVSLDYPIAITLVAAPTDDNPHVVTFVPDSGMSVVSGSPLTFTSANWNVPQYVTVTATTPAITNEDQIENPPVAHVLSYTVDPAIGANIVGTISITFSGVVYPTCPVIPPWDSSFFEVFDLEVQQPIIVLATV